MRRRCLPSTAALASSLKRRCARYGRSTAIHATRSAVCRLALSRAICATMRWPPSSSRCWLHLAVGNMHASLSLHAYSNHATEDSVTQRLRGYVKHWHPVASLSDAALAEKIRADGIDILIDLSGHTADNRLLTFARKPAPVQVELDGLSGHHRAEQHGLLPGDRFFLPPGSSTTNSRKSWCICRPMRRSCRTRRRRRSMRCRRWATAI